MTLKTLKDFRCSKSLSGNYRCCEKEGITGNPCSIDFCDLRKEAIEWIKAQKVPEESEKDGIMFFIHCQKCLENKELSGLMEVGTSQSESLFLIKCFTCKTIVKRINFAEIQNDWIKHFFNISEENLKKLRGN